MTHDAFEEHSGMAAVLVAQPQPWDPGDAAHRESAASLRAALQARGALKRDPALVAVTRVGWLAMCGEGHHSE